MHERATSTSMRLRAVESRKLNCEYRLVQKYSATPDLSSELGRTRSGGLLLNQPVHTGKHTKHSPQNSFCVLISTEHPLSNDESSMYNVASLSSTFLCNFVVDLLRSRHLDRLLCCRFGRARLRFRLWFACRTCKCHHRAYRSEEYASPTPFERVLLTRVLSCLRKWSKVNAKMNRKYSNALNWFETCQD